MITTPNNSALDVDAAAAAADADAHDVDADAAAAAAADADALAVAFAGAHVGGPPNPLVVPPVVAQNPAQPAVVNAMPPAHQVPLPVVPIFNLTPYGKILDFANATDTKLYSSASAPFASAFDGTPAGLIAFTDQVHTRAISIACRDIFYVHDGTDFNGHALFRDILTKWSSISPADAKASADAHWASHNWRQQSSFILGNVILESTTTNFRNRLIQHKIYYASSLPGWPATHETHLRTRLC